MPESILYHNPSCSKSRLALELLQARKVNPRIIRYLTEPLTVDELELVLMRLAVQPREMMRRHELEYMMLGLDDPTLSHSALVTAMVKHPQIIERPIFVHAGRAIIARPPERVLELI
jgi:arsenate reductase (glutaredoxin)